MSSPVESRSYRYYDFLMAAFVTVLLASNLIGPGKVCRLGGLTFGAASIFFPLTYIFGDVLTEVYGYARARRVIWAGFGAMVFATIVTVVVLRLPPSPLEPWNATLQPALETVFGGTARIVVASLAAFWIGDFVNSYVLAKLKIRTGGRFLWMRTIGSTIVGQGIDSVVFYPLAFAGVWSGDVLSSVVLFNGGFKVGVEVIMTPVTYAVVAFLKRAEGEDFYDARTNFTPFSLRT